MIWADHVWSRGALVLAIWHTLCFCNIAWADHLRYRDALVQVIWHTLCFFNKPGIFLGQIQIEPKIGGYSSVLSPKTGNANSRPSFKTDIFINYSDKLILAGRHQSFAKISWTQVTLYLNLFCGWSRFLIKWPTRQLHVILSSDTKLYVYRYISRCTGYH